MEAKNKGKGNQPKVQPQPQPQPEQKQPEMTPAQALEVQKAARKAVCQVSAREMSGKVDSTEKQDADGNKYKIWFRRSYVPKEQSDGTWKAVETGRVTLVPVGALPAEVSTEDKAAWNRVKRDMAHRMVLSPNMTVDAIGLSRDNSGRDRGIIRVIQSSTPVHEASGEKLLESVAAQLADVVL